jgi:hypothetical protein
MSGVKLMFRSGDLIVTAAESRVELATRLAHQADDLLRDGVASKIDVSRAQVRLREEQQSLIDAQRDADSSGIFFAYEAVAMYDAANSIQRRYQPFAVSADAPKGDSVDAAVVAAAHDVLVHYFQDQQGVLDSLEANSLGKIADSQAKTDSIAGGQAVAQRWNDLRTGDGLEAPIQYVWGHGPGIWEPVPPFPPPATPWLPRPFTFDSASDFRSSVPPLAVLNSAVWALDYNLTKNFGALNGSLRTLPRRPRLDSSGPITLWSSIPPQLGASSPTRNC